MSPTEDLCEKVVDLLTEHIGKACGEHQRTALVEALAAGKAAVVSLEMFNNAKGVDVESNKIAYAMVVDLCQNFSRAFGAAAKYRQ